MDKEVIASRQPARHPSLPAIAGCCILFHSIVKWRPSAHLAARRACDGTTPPMERVSGADLRVARRKTVRRACEALEREYGRPRFGNPTNPVDDLVYIVLSNKTGPETARQTFRNLKRRFKTWDELVEARLTQVRRVLKTGGACWREVEAASGCSEKNSMGFRQVFATAPEA